MSERTVRLLVAATELLRIPSLWAGLRSEHLPDRDGRCLACRPCYGERRYWPCRVHRLAERAYHYRPSRSG